MVEELERASPDRQAIWVALKTLRQRPTVGGRSDDGATVYAVRDVELVLPPGASHFKRLVPCAKCGRRVPGSVVLGPADLDRPATPLFCGRCGQAVERRTREPSRETAETPAPAPPQDAPPVVTGSAVDDGRLAAVEAQLAELLSRAPAPDETAGEPRRLSEQVAAQLQAQRAELANLAASVAALRAGMRELGESNRALDHARGELDQRMVELAAQVTALPAAVPETVTAQDHAQLRGELAEGLGLLRAEIGHLEQRSQDEVASVAALLETQRKELTEALHDVAQETLLAVAEPLRDLTKAREEFERRVEALTASARAAAARLQGLEQKAQRPVRKRRPPKALVESLEQQLRDAEERLGQL
jgi:hypothetical protein